ncbi:MAG: GntR family transcriptional regulator [Verrucomicrobiales bacterium]
MSSKRNDAPQSMNLRAGGLSAEGQIYSILKAEIQSGHWDVGSSMPSLRELAARFGVSRVPVHRAIIKLEEQHLVKRVHGSGVHVIRTQPLNGERKLPLMQTFDVLNRPETALNPGPGEATHFVSAALQSMLWHLAKSRAVRLQRIPVVDQSDMLQVLQDLPHSQVDVFIFVSPELIPLKHLNLLRRFVHDGGSVVYRATWMDIPEFDAVKLDFELGQHALTEHYLNRGVKRMVRCALPHEAVFESQKRAGYRRACLENGWLIEAVSKSELEAPASGGDRAEELKNAIRWLKTRALPLKPEIIFAVNDPEAAILRLALLQLGRPEIEVAGYDAVWREIDWGKFLVGLPAELVREVEAMRQPVSVDAGHWEMGEAMGRLALERATKKLPRGPQVRILPQKLVLPD